MPIPRFTAAADTGDVATALRDHGCAIVDKLAPADVVARVSEELAPHIARSAFGADEFSGAKTRRTGPPGAAPVPAGPVSIQVSSPTEDGQ